MRNKKDTHTSTKVIGLSYTLLLLTLNEENKYAQPNQRINSSDESTAEIKKRIKKENAAQYAEIKFMQKKAYHGEKKCPGEAPLRQASSYSPRKR